jgi:hypothetical protein
MALLGELHAFQVTAERRSLDQRRRRRTTSAAVKDDDENKYNLKPTFPPSSSRIVFDFSLPLSHFNYHRAKLTPR